MVPNGPFIIKRYLSKSMTPLIILTDKGSQVADQYFQVKRFFSIGTPTVFVVNQEGKIAYTFYGNSPLDEPGNQEPLAVLAKLTYEI